MKVYGIFTDIEIGETSDARVEACVSLVADLVVDCLRRGGDRFHYAVDWRDPGAEPDAGFWTAGAAEPHVARLDTADRLRDRVRRCVDPFDAAWCTIRSIATCRAATFGSDGQAFVCLRDEDTPPVSPDPALVIVEERPDILAGFDYFDGWLPGDD